MQETLSENSYTDVRKSERSIVNITLSQNNYADVSENTITELKYEEHKEPSVTDKVTSYFNIFECGRNLLDQLDVTYQGVLFSTLEGDYYKKMLKNLIKVNNNKGEPLCNEKLRQAVLDLREGMYAENERNINNITCDDLY